MELTNEQTKAIIELCVYEIKSNKDLIENIKDTREIGIWKEENEFFLQIINTLTQKNKIENQLVLQGLTTEQEDFLLEESLERIREEREK